MAAPAERLSSAAFELLYCCISEAFCPTAGVSRLLQQIVAERAQGTAEQDGSEWDMMAEAE